MFLKAQVTRSFLSLLQRCQRKRYIPDVETIATSSHRQGVTAREAVLRRLDHRLRGAPKMPTVRVTYYQYSSSIVLLNAE